MRNHPTFQMDQLRQFINAYRRRRVTWPFTLISTADVEAIQYVLSWLDHDDDQYLPASEDAAKLVENVLRSYRGTREDYQCRLCGDMMSAHTMSTLGSLFCPGELEAAMQAVANKSIHV